jgi:hypothetical protein
MQSKTSLFLSKQPARSLFRERTQQLKQKRVTQNED